MSNIVLGLATSHSPLLTFGADMWVERAKDDLVNPRLTLTDGRTLSYAELSAETSDRYATVATREHFEDISDKAQACLDRLADALARARPDVVIIVGDDQEELFGANCTPAIALYCGEELVMHPLIQVRPDLPEWRKIAARAYGLDAPHRHPGAADYAVRLTELMMAEGVDIAVSSSVENPEKAGFGHAYGFVVGRLYTDRAIPTVPVLLNTYFPPNVPSAARCHDFGRAMRRAIEAIPDDLRIAVIASGGLSHFTTDEVLDQKVMGSLDVSGASVLRSIPKETLRSGSSEILNWIMTAGALEGLPLQWSEYLPVYRTPAGTGIGLGFAIWQTD